MSRTELLDNNYKFEQKRPKRTVIFVLRVSLFAFFIIISSQIIMQAYKVDSSDKIHLSSNLVIAIFIGIVLLYFAMKVLLMSLFCQYKRDSIATFKVLEEGGISIFTCREALKMWQIILIYSVPAVLSYSMLCAMIALWTFEAVFMFFLFLTSFFMACDFTIAIYVIYAKITYRPDYIAINHHIYNLTLYTKPVISEKI